MAGLIKPNTYPNSTAITITLVSLATTSADPPVGREGVLIDQAGVQLANDLMLDGKITTGTSPTAGKIQIWAWGSGFDGSTHRRPAGATGTDAGLTPGVHWKDVWWPLVVLNTSASSNITYDFAGVSFLKNFGGLYLPEQCGVFVFHNTAVALNATGGNHEIRFTPVNTQYT